MRCGATTSYKVAESHLQHCSQAPECCPKEADGRAEKIQARLYSAGNNHASHNEG